jgi:hypothetical protein
VCLCIRNWRTVLEFMPAAPRVRRPPASQRSARGEQRSQFFTTFATTYTSNPVRTKVVKKPIAHNALKAQVHCFICSHTVPAEVEYIGRKIHLMPGQKCPRCASALEAAKVIETQEAA